MFVITAESDTGDIYTQQFESPDEAIAVAQGVADDYLAAGFTIVGDPYLGWIVTGDWCPTHGDMAHRHMMVLSITDTAGKRGRHEMA